MRNKITWNTLSKMNGNNFEKEFWTSRDTYTTKKSVVQKYVCKNPGCNYMIRRILDNTDESIIYQANGEFIHTCFDNDNLHITKRAKIKICMKNLTDQVNYYQPNLLIQQVNSKMGFKIPSKIVYQHIAACKRNISRNEQNNDTYVGDIKQLITDLKEKDSNIIFELIDAPFFLYISSLDNIKKLQNAKHFNMDFTYKITTPDYPLLVFGFSDANRKFHLTSFCLSRYEDEKTVELCLKFTSNFCETQGFPLAIETVTADHGKQFFNPIINHNKKTKVLQCWFHTAQLIKKKLDLTLDLHRSILNDVQYMQILSAQDLFFKYYELFKKIC